MLNHFDNSPYAYERRAGALEQLVALQNSKNPGALHLIIHAYDQPGLLHIILSIFQ